MQKNFKQPLTKQPTNIYFLLQNRSSKKYLAITKESLDSTFYSVASITLETLSDLPLQLTAQLYNMGFILNHYRELNRRTDVMFSFADETPGETRETICFHAVVDMPKTNDSKDIQKLALDELLSYLQESPILDPTVEIGIAMLLNEKATTQS